ncbi:MAG: hypothetical protein M0P61_06955 [Ignavibacteriaceae bacterium]|jgi:hypothetical protein|nr:hypothetical protein [Ignavibacteriaceae bacterium]
MEINEAELEKEIEEDLRTNPKYQDFYQQYRPSSIEDFIKGYIKKKMLWIKYGELYVQGGQKRALRYKTIAKQLLWEIQQVKLFDMQCFWRAEQLEIPGIAITQDFIYWEKNIENCPFLPPISEEEVNLYKEYALTDDADIPTGYFHYGFEDWQHYDEIKRSFVNQDDDYVTAPDWYLFYYNRRGGAPCAYLPDIRGDKEDFYFALWRKHHYPISTQPSPQSVETRPSFSYYDDNNIREFVNRFENRKIREYAEVMMENNEAEDDEDLLEAITTLKAANERIEIVAENLPWRDAIMKTVELYERQKVYEELDGAYNSYLQRLKLGIAFETDEDIAFYKNLADLQRRHLLEARKLNNEPEDFNF